MGEAAEVDAQRRQEAAAPPARQGLGRGVEDRRPRHDREDQGGEEEGYQVVEGGHGGLRFELQRDRSMSRTVRGLPAVLTVDVHSQHGNGGQSILQGTMT